MSARAIWKGRLLLGRHEVPVKMYSAVEDRAVHFKLLSGKDHAPVKQQIVRKDTGAEVSREDQRKAVAVDDGRAVILQPGELESLVPPASREIHLCRFVPAGLLGDQWFDRPYLLGPDEDGDEAYFALAKALAGREVTGIARWVMRRKRYLGSLSVAGDYLRMITLRRSEQVLALPALVPAKAREPSEAERKLAVQLVDSITADFEPQAWHNEYRERLMALIAAKAGGGKVKPFKPRSQAASSDLEQALRASLAAPRERKRA